ncbi:MAG TPA: hypothetical protein VJ865_09720 [Gemmatimonadaceae bacterium]|nr:hypothetical protein [Gemmatimonadaceae bacterium]
MNRHLGAVLVAGIFAGSGPMSADDPIALSVRPAVAKYPGNAELKVLVARNEMNRALLWEVEGEVFYRSSSIQLNGASAPRTHTFRVRGLPGGDFEVRATVRRSDDSTAVVTGRIKVVGGPDEAP